MRATSASHGEAECKQSDDAPSEFDSAPTRAYLNAVIKVIPGTLLSDEARLGFVQDCVNTLICTHA